MWEGSSVVSYISLVKQRVKHGRSPPVGVNPRVDSVLPGPIQGDAVGHTPGQIAWTLVPDGSGFKARSTTSQSVTMERDVMALSFVSFFKNENRIYQP